jgi:hypothetical protein
MTAPGAKVMAIAGEFVLVVDEPRLFLDEKRGAVEPRACRPGEAGSLEDPDAALCEEEP